MSPLERAKLKKRVQEIMRSRRVSEREAWSILGRAGGKKSGESRNNAKSAQTPQLPLL